MGWEGAPAAQRCTSNVGIRCAAVGERNTRDCSVLMTDDGWVGAMLPRAFLHMLRAGGVRLHGRGEVSVGGSVAGVSAFTSAVSRASRGVYDGNGRLSAGAVAGGGGDTA